MLWCDQSLYGATYSSEWKMDSLSYVYIQGHMFQDIENISLGNNQIRH